MKKIAGALFIAAILAGCASNPAEKQTTEPGLWQIAHECSRELVLIEGRPAIVLRNCHITKVYGQPTADDIEKFRITLRNWENAPPNFFLEKQ